MDRTDRIASEMKRVVSDIIRTELKDPRIPVVTSVTRLKLAKDLKFAKIYVSFFGNEAEKKGAMQALKASAGLIRYQIGQKMTIRALPELTFALDESIEYGSYMTERISQVRAEDKLKEAKAGEAAEDVTD
jgi:ribosome-binding factor A